MWHTVAPPRPRDTASRLLRRGDISLRAFALADAPRVAALVGDHEVSRWTSNIPHPYSVGDAETWIRSEPSSFHQRAFAVDLRGELVACVSFWPEDSGGVEIGYWVGKAYWGHSIATDAVRAMMHSTLFPQQTRVHARIIATNTASQRVLEKCGFERRGTGTIEVKGQKHPSRVFVCEPRGRARRDGSI